MKNNKLLNILLMLLIVYVLYLMKDLWGGVYYKLIAILKPFIIGFALAYALNPFLRWMQSKKIPKGISIAIIILIVLAFIVFVIWSIIPVFTSELGNLYKGLLEFTKDVSSKFDIDLSGVQKSLKVTFNKISKDIAREIPNQGVNILNTSINFVSNFIISTVAFIYLLIDMDNIRSKVKKYFKRKSKKTYKLVKEIDYETTNYFKGLFTNVLIQFIEYTLLYKLIGHPNFLLLGVIAAFSPLIPYFGGIIMNVIAIITASVVSPTLLILSCIICLVFPQLDGYLIIPKIYGKTNKVPALLTIFAVFAGGVLGGMVGIIIALPLTIILLTIYRNYDEEISEKIEEIKEKI
ncbi:MAG: AI-2E family transporter [Bacilli bacterium]|nr:AI-2E family transporter [Bacilli bacterium]